MIEYFSHVLVALYETSTKPVDPNEFIREQLSAAFPDDTDALRSEIQEMEERIAERENTLHDFHQANYELRRALRAKGLTEDEIHTIAANARLERPMSQDGDEGDDDYNEATQYVFKYHDASVVDIEHDDLSLPGVIDGQPNESATVNNDVGEEEEEEEAQHED